MKKSLKTVGGLGFKNEYSKGPQSIDILETQPPFIFFILKSIVLFIFIIIVLAIVFVVGTMITGEGM